MNLCETFTRATTTPGTSPSSTSWSTRANVSVNSKGEKLMFAKFAYTPAMFSGSMWMFSWRSGLLSSTRLRYTGGGQLHPRPRGAHLRRSRGAAGDRNDWLPPDPARELAQLVLPDGRHVDPQRPRLGAPRRLGARLDDRGRPRRRHYLC